MESAVTIKGERIEIVEAFDEPIIQAMERGFEAQKQITGHVAYRLLKQHGLSLVEDSELYRDLVDRLCFRHLELNKIAADICCGREWTLPVEKDRSEELLSVEEARSKAKASKGLGRVTFKPMSKLAAEFIVVVKLFWPPSFEHSSISLLPHSAVNRRYSGVAVFGCSSR